jgi:phosphohistidine phosphatase
MKQLILLRHGEAQAKRPGLSDFDRALTGYGRTEALDAADCLKQVALRLDEFLVSPAVRARETALIVAAQLDFNHELRYDQQLYGEEMRALLQSLQRCGSTAAAVLMVGHNPAISILAGHLANGRPVSQEPLVQETDTDSEPEASESLNRASSAEPLELTTAGICRVQFEAETWGELSPHTVTAVSLLR